MSEGVNRDLRPHVRVALAVDLASGLAAPHRPPRATCAAAANGRWPREQSRRKSSLRAKRADFRRRCPRPESNQRTRFRKPLLYALSYGGSATLIVPCLQLDERAPW